MMTLAVCAGLLAQQLGHQPNLSWRFRQHLHRQPEDVCAPCTRCLRHGIRACVAVLVVLHAQSAAHSCLHTDCPPGQTSARTCNPPLVRIRTSMCAHQCTSVRSLQEWNNDYFKDGASGRCEPRGLRPGAGWCVSHNPQLHRVNCAALSLTFNAPDRIALCTGRWRPAHSAVSSRPPLTLPVATCAA